MLRGPASTDSDTPSDVEMTYRVARRLFGLRAVGEEVRKAVRPLYRPKPGCEQGRRPIPADAAAESVAPALPPSSPASYSFPPIDYSALDVVMAQADQVVAPPVRRYLQKGWRRPGLGVDSSRGRSGQAARFGRC